MLLIEKEVIATHDDYTPWSGVNVGFDDDKSLIVEKLKVDYDNGGQRTREVIVISSDDAWRLSRRSSVRLTGLPDFFAERFGREGADVTPSDVKEVFNEIREYFSGMGIVYKIKNY